MTNREEQKKRIEQFFAGVEVNGIGERTLHFDEDREGYIGVQLQSSVTDSMIYLSIPEAAPSPQEAVIAEILSKRVAPSEDASGLASITLLEANEYENGVDFVKFHKYSSVIVSSALLSGEAMDRLCAAWIAWRVKHYKADADEGPGELEDHAF